MKTNTKKSAAILLLSMLAVLLLLYGLFRALVLQYQRNSAYSSAAHLIEINRQVRDNISSVFKKDRLFLKDLRSEIESDRTFDEAELRQYIKDRCAMWEEGEVRLYTASGVCLNGDEIVSSNGSASDFAAGVLRRDETFRILKSQAEYALPVRSDREIQGSRIVAISVIHNLDTILDDLGISSFGGKGNMYLARQDGVEISQKSGQTLKSVYNVLSLFDQGRLLNISGGTESLGDTMAAGAEGTYLYTGGSMSAHYVICTPVEITDQKIYLLNIVPQSIVNSTMNAFSSQVLLLSVLTIALVVLIFVIFFILYRRRADKYDADLRVRERLFDLLVSETKNAFMLLKSGSADPLYVSSNMKDIIGTGSFALRNENGKFRLADRAVPGSPAVAEINKALAGWNGAQDFLSGYLPYAENQRDHYFRLLLHPASTNTGEYIGIIQDVTPEYRREQSLRDALSLADSANRAKTQFLSSVSHDIRTPLNAIINMTRFLKEDSSDRERNRHNLDIILQSSEHLLSLINDVLDMSRIESGRLTFSNESFRLNDVLEEVTSMIRPLCGKKQQELLVHTAGFRHGQLKGDPLRLNQILVNLLNNAVKFTPENGRIELTVTELPAIRTGSVPFRFTVKDNGIGIPDDKLKTIFEPFSRIESEQMRGTEGTGLGLAITKSFIDALGGTVRVHSVPGEGSAFQVELSYGIDSAGRQEQADGTAGAAGTAEGRTGAAAGDGTEAAIPAAHLAGKRVLLAEDNPINAEITEQILQKAGVTTETAADGKLAADSFAAHEAYYFAAVLMDIQMPVMDGYEAAGAIRRMKRADAKTIPIIALTANAFSEDIERARSAGMNAHVPKPIDPAELTGVLNSVITGRNGI